MKKLRNILVMGVALVGIASLSATKSLAQASTVSRYNKQLDTVTNTSVKNMTTLRVAGDYSTVTISTVNTQLTGTMAGVARLYGSLDGVDYYRIRATQLQGSQIDSVIINNGTNAKYAWVVLRSPFQYYQVQTTGTGTSTFTVKGKYVAH